MSDLVTELMEALNFIMELMEISHRGFKIAHGVDIEPIEDSNLVMELVGKLNFVTELVREFKLGN